jgi:hypothetical protein
MPGIVMCRERFVEGIVSWCTGASIASAFQPTHTPRVHIHVPPPLTRAGASCNQRNAGRIRENIQAFERGVTCGRLPWGGGACEGVHPTKVYINIQMKTGKVAKTASPFPSGNYLTTTKRTRNDSTTRLLTPPSLSSNGEQAAQLRQASARLG